nr:transmembrane and immunoglobulin domain-containing protein 2 [Kogia breviceps]
MDISRLAPSVVMIFRRASCPQGNAHTVARTGSGSREAIFVWLRAGHVIQSTLKSRKCRETYPHFTALQGATGLSVQQAPKLLQVRQDSQVTLACQVVQAQAWERLHVEWTKDGDILCQTHIINGSLTVGVCGPWGRISWQPPGNLTLQLDHVSLSDSGLYVCWATVEIPDLEEAQGNGTQLLVETDGGLLNRSFPGLSFPLLVTGAVAVAVAVAAFALGAWIWGRRRCRNRDAGNPIYSNALYKPQRAPRKTEAWPV